MFPLMKKDRADAIVEALASKQSASPAPAEPQEDEMTASARAFLDAVDRKDPQAVLKAVHNMWDGYMYPPTEEGSSSEEG